MPTATITDDVQGTLFRYELTEKSHLSQVTRSIVAAEEQGYSIRYFTRHESGVMVVYTDTTL